MVREATFAWDLTAGRFDPLNRRESVLDEDLLVLKCPRRKRRRKAPEHVEQPARPARREPITRRHLADADWTTGDLQRVRRRKG